jgi:hypothetical protein
MIVRVPALVCRADMGRNRWSIEESRIGKPKCHHRAAAKKSRRFWRMSHLPEA